MPGQDQDTYRSRLFRVPSGDLKYISRYNFESEELQDIQQRKLIPVVSYVLDMTVARDWTNPFIIGEPGRAIVIYGININGGGANAPYDPVANTGIEPVSTTAFAFCRFNQQDFGFDYGIPLKHNRGFIGTFIKAFLTWPAQSNTKARAIVYKWDGLLWQNGEAAT